MSLVHRASVALLSTALVVSAGSPAQAAAAPASSPAGHGATWLSKQLTGGLIHNDRFGVDDYGLSIDTAFALKAIGGHSTEVQQVRQAMAVHVADYTTFEGSQFAGSFAKLMVLAERTGGDPRDFGGVNLVRRLSKLIVKSGPATGRIHDQSAFGDNANTVGQVLAVRGLTAAHSGYAAPARRFLLQQQCDAGYFRLFFSKRSSSHQSCGRNSPADPDATSYAVIQLWRTSKGHPRFRAALKHAVAWLAKQQRPSGAFIGSATTAVVNTNSTGLASWALATGGRCSAAKQAATWVAALQVGRQTAGSPLAGQRGAIAYNRHSLRVAQHDGIVLNTQDEWRRATSQAAPSLLFRHGC
jgi:hypothetical protein